MGAPSSLTSQPHAAENGADKDKDAEQALVPADDGGGDAARAAATVAAVKDIVLLLPCAAFLVIFWVVYSQMNTNFINQGCQMNLSISGSTNNNNDGGSQARRSVVRDGVCYCSSSFVPAPVQRLSCRDRKRVTIVAMCCVCDPQTRAALGRAALAARHGGHHRHDPCLRPLHLPMDRARARPARRAGAPAARDG